ncbi:MAG: NUDIX hydrolase [Oligoflexales bacterium]
MSTGFICFEDKYLLLKRADIDEQAETWGTPGGKLEKNESALDAFHREIKEETGIEISGLEIKLVGSYFAHHTKYYYKLHVYISDIISLPKIKLSPSEHSDYIWADLDSMRSYPLILGQDDIICELEKYLSRNNDQENWKTQTEK